MHISQLILTLLGVSFSICSPIREKVRRDISDPTSIANGTFDYVIIGGGLTGLVVASRLTEDRRVTALVIEAGQDNHDDPRVYDVRTYGAAFGTDLDHRIASTPVPWRDGLQLPMIAGKTLGGSDSINGASWTKGPKTQYDLLPLLNGDDSWAFEPFNKIMKSAENFTRPDARLVSKGADYQPKDHGEGGPVQVSFAPGMFSSIQIPALNASQKVWSGLQDVSDAASGVVNGITVIPNMIEDSPEQRRSSGQTAYILGEPETRKNLVVLTGHRGTKIHWADTQSKDNLTAEGVEFQPEGGGEKYYVHAKKEVLVAAGSMQSPQFLELSGVGDPTVLKAAGVPVRKPLVGVGRNLQEQTKNAIEFSPKDVHFDGSGPSTAIAFPNVQQMLGDNASTVYQDTLDGLTAHAAKLKSQGMVVSESATYSILKHQLDNLFKQKEAAAEIFYTISPDTDTVGADLWNLIVLSRGSIHIKSDNPFEHPVVDPNYFGHYLDLQLQTYATMQTYQAFQTDPLAPLIRSEKVPGNALPANASYSDWEHWVTNTFTSVWHPIATLSMMKEEFGGVVDNRLKVYGLNNVRAIDASVLPIQLSAHLSSSLYGIAEKAAIMIKEDHRGE